jgi:ABC-type phosphate transport system substrate-binding protein
MRAVRAALLTLLLALIAVASTVSAQQLAPAPPAPAYRVIVHPRNSITHLDRIFLQDAFFQRTTRWPNGRVIHPTDLIPSSSARRKFSQEVLGRSVEAIKAYWQQRIFSGRDVPPPEFDGDAKVVAYVLQNEGAIGYVSGAASLGGSRVIIVGR